MRAPTNIPDLDFPTMPQPLISVIIPSYNCARYIAAALHSALDQDYPHKEILVVDDGSTDNSLDILRSFGKRIRVITQANAGAAAARNTGLQAAQGEYIAFLDADDLWLPGKLTAQANYLAAHPETGLVYSAWQEWHARADGEFDPPAPVPEAANPSVEIVPEESGWMYNRLLLDCAIHTTTAMIRSKIAREVGMFDVNLRRGQDYDYWLRVSRITPIHKLKAVLSLYRIHRESITRKPHAANYGYLVIKHALDRWGRVGPDGSVTPKREVDQVLARMWFGYGYTHYIAGDCALAVNAFQRCIVHRPFWYSGWVYWFKSSVKWLKQRIIGK